MSLNLKLCFMVSLIYLCPFVLSLRPRQKSICTELVPSTNGVTKVRNCCNGYTNTGPSKYLSCKPICTTGCPNGRCVAPEVCYCNIGFTINPETFLCEPRCSESCYNSDCIAPDTCKCRPGFRELNTTYCEPIPLICSPSCFNGDCVGPNKCQCHDGYELSGWVRGGFDYTCLPRTTTSTTTTTRAVITSIDENEVEEYSSVPAEEVGSPDQDQVVTDQDQTVTEQDQEVTDQDQAVTDQDGSHRSEEAETNTELVFVTEVNESSISEKTMTLNVSFGIFTGETKNSTKVWIYIFVAALLVAVVILLMVAYRRRLMGCVKGRSYVVQGQQTRRASSLAFNVTFSSVSN